MDKTRLEAFSDGVIAIIIASQETNSLLKKAVGSDLKGKLSPILYMIAIAISFWAQWISQGLFILVALIWLVPDRRIEKALVDKEIELLNRIDSPR